MWYEFDLQLNKDWDDPNLRICFLWKNRWKSVLSFDGYRIFTLRDEIAQNLMNILKTDQVLNCIWDEILNGDITTKGLFQDCHSFALSLAIWSSCVKHGLLTQERLVNVWLEKIISLKLSDNLPNLKQWDILTSEVDNGSNHSIVYLWKDIYSKDTFISCNGKDWYIDYEWKWIEKIDVDVLKEISLKKNWKIYVKEWYRIWWSLSLVHIHSMYERCRMWGINTIDIYRKKENRDIKLWFKEKLFKVINYICD
jgi:hypothetical protein